MLLRRMTFNNSGMTLYGNKVAVPLLALNCTEDSVVNTAHIFIITQTAEAALGGGGGADGIYLWAICSTGVLMFSFFCNREFPHSFTISSPLCWS